MFRSVSFARRFSTHSEPNIALESDTIESNRNYEDDIVLLFYNSMLEVIVDKWMVIEEEKSLDTNDEVVIEVKDLTKDPSVNEIRRSSVGEMWESKASLIKKNMRHSQMNSTGEVSKSSVSKKHRKSPSMIKSKRKTSHSSASSRETSRKNMEITESNLRFSKGNTSQMHTPSNFNYSPSSHNTSTPELAEIAEIESVIVKFKNGNVYTGPVTKKRFDGEGQFVWSDGAVYEGEFKAGEITGRGKLFYEENSYSSGDFCKGLLHGISTIYIAATDILYSGEWRNGKKHGNGWLLYETDNWYEGEWLDGIRHGKGLRQYNKLSRYQGDWLDGERHGDGTMVWDNQDYYSGEWKHGTMDGYGEYIWKGFFNKDFVFPLQNCYEGHWISGMRSGMGVLHFGFNGGARMAGQFVRNMKHGAGIIVCGNGKIVKGNLLFMYDKPVDMQLFNSGKSLASITNMEVNRNNVSNKKMKGDFTINSESNIEDKLCPEHEQDLNRMNMFAEIPTTYSSQINPLRIPVHSEPKQINLKYYLRKVSEIYGFENASQDNLFSSKEIDLDEELQQGILEFEEKKLRFAITCNCLLLQTAYQVYATITTTKPIQFRVVLVRLFLWQLYIDVGLTEKISLIETDLLLLDNPDSGLEYEHYPFEKIYFWQFIYAIISTALRLYSENLEEYKSNGILATVFKKFLTEYIGPVLTRIKGGILQEYANILPIKNMYLLYKSVGEPHTVRKFFSTCLNKFGNICDKLLEDDKVMQFRKGKNVVIGQLMYIPNDLDVGEKPEEPIPYPLTEGVCKNLRLFKKLRPKHLINCISKVCPKVMEDKVIVNMDYKISFLEFYNIVITASLKIIDNIKKLEQRQMESRITNLSSVDSRSRTSRKSSIRRFKK